MIYLTTLVPMLDEFLIGDITTKKILPPESVSHDQVLYARVASITAEESTPVIWLDLSEKPDQF